MEHKYLDLSASRARSTFGQTLLLFSIVFLLTLLILGGTLSLLYSSERELIAKDLLAREQNTLTLQLAAIERDLQSVASDILFLSKHKDLVYLVHPDSASRYGMYLSYIQDQYLSFAIAKNIYDQIRFINADGLELVRVNRGDHGPEIVPEHALQDKSGRYYYRDSLELDRGDIYISHFDLNMEHGVIEEPFKPMIRFATPVLDSMDQPQGVVVVNYRAQQLLDHVLNAAGQIDGQTMMINGEGYWLLHPDPDLAWGFMRSGQEGLTIDNEFPDEWQLIREQESGQVQTPMGVFTFASIRPETLVSWTTEEGEQTCQHNRDVADIWIMLRHVPQAQVQGLYAKVDRTYFILAGVMLLFSTPGSWLLALGMVRRREYQRQLMALAHFDKLTGLANRALFFDRLDMATRRAKRNGNKVALLFIDLDGFKGVNDSMGHGAGDELLVCVSRLLEQCVRKSDTVSRLGGDEFGVILSDITTADDAKMIGDKILATLGAPCSLESGTVLIGASIGVAIYPDHSTDHDLMVQYADSAMYKAKQFGKNLCMVYDG